MPTFTRLGKLQTGTPQSQEFAIYGFGGGLNVKGLPQTIPDSDLAIAQDGYLTQSGGFQLRNGMTPYGLPFSNGGPVYVQRFYQEVINGVEQSPEVVKLVAVHRFELFEITPTGNVSLGLLGGAVDQVPTFARIQNPNDGHFPDGLTDCLVICTGKNVPHIYDGANVYFPLGWADVLDASWCAVVNGILWFGGIPDKPNQIFGTGDGIIDSMQTLPAYRNFVFSSPVMGLCASGTGAQAALIIGLNDGFAILTGTGPSNYYLQETPFSDAATAGRAMISWNGTTFVLGHSAVYAFGLGQIPAPISDKIEPWILNRPTTSIPTYPGYPLALNRELSWMTVYNNRLHMGYCSQDTQPDTILVFDLVIGGWTVLRPTPGIASMCLLDAPGDPNPYVAMVGGTNGQVYTWDVQPEADQTVMDDTTPVLAQVQTKFYKVGVPGTNKAMERFYPEFYIAGEFKANFDMLVNYGSGGVTTPLDLPYQSIFGIWDVSAWDNAEWGSNTGPQFLAFSAPTTRIDYPGTQAESFSFGVQMTQALAPWIFAGGSGVWHQRGRT